MRRVLAVTAAFALLGLGITAQAAITIDTAYVGDAGNTVDTTGFGSVDYDYRIGKYEVTAGQYTAFLNAVATADTYGLYNANMASTDDGSGINRSGPSGSYSYTVDAAFVNRPVNYVSFWDACRFANWLGNGQKSGAQDATTTERGAYTLDGYTGIDGRTIQRNAGWTWAITSEDEWYKAAYYKGGGTNAGYWLFPTKSDSAPGRDLDDVFGNNANYYGDPFPLQPPYYTTVVGEFQNSESAYATFDQGGNVWEWNEAIPYIADSLRSLGGGSFCEDVDLLWSKYCYHDYFYYHPSTEYNFTGFRVSQAVPEPSSIIALLGGLVPLFGLRRRKVSEQAGSFHR